MTDQQVTIKFTGDASGFNIAAKDVNAGLASIGLAAAGTSAAIGGIFAQGTREFLAFDNALKQSGVVSDSLGTTEFAGLRAEVERLGIVTSKAPADIAQTSVALSRAGFSATETAAAMEGIVRASEATGESLEVVGDISAKTIRTFGLSANESERIADILVSTANSTNTTVNGIGESLPIDRVTQ
jgi:phage tail tape measure protein, TP901 family, core region